jgi:hypothetical protein
MPASVSVAGPWRLEGMCSGRLRTRCGDAGVGQDIDSAVYKANRFDLNVVLVGNID